MQVYAWSGSLSDPLAGTGSGPAHKGYRNCTGVAWISLVSDRSVWRRWFGTAA